MSNKCGNCKNKIDNFTTRNPGKQKMMKMMMMKKQKEDTDDEEQDDEDEADLMPATKASPLKLRTGQWVVVN